ncbi:BppU family phage baseplate upper protein [Staphylococcus epidermidis]|uniref:BppU family phage baseplate upper protein n=1 Tax=Staphylococcus epidermidis TaxID=1282 RepID=UPI0027382DC1|nr:BppU family phage baseplate upper protein [Staphylococcus epidermidis]
METYKTGTVNTIINENGVDLGSINVNLYTMDNKTSVIDIHIKKKNIINENQEYISVNFNQTKFEPVLHVFAQDGSIFTNEPLEIVKAEEGFVRYIIPEYITKHVGQMQCKLFLENPENNDSTHVANFYFTVNDSGITKSVGKEIRVELLDDIVEKVMKDNVDIFKGPKGDTGEQGPAGQDGKDGKNGLNGIDGVNGNPGPQGPPGKDGRDGVNGKDGSDGKSFDFESLTEEQKAEITPKLPDFSNWQQYRFTENDGTRKWLGTLSKPVETLEPGLYECSIPSDNQSVNAPADINGVGYIAEINVTKGQSGRKQIILTQSNRNNIWSKVIHTNGDDKGWTQLNPQSQKYKLTNDDGTNFYTGFGTTNLNNEDEIKKLPTGIRYITRVTGLPSDVSSNEGWLLKLTRSDSQLSTLYFQPYNSSQLLQRVTYNGLSEWRYINQASTDTGWVPLPLLNGAEADVYSDSYLPVSYRVRKTGDNKTVQIIGNIKKLNTGSVFAQLPLNITPTKNIEFKLNQRIGTSNAVGYLASDGTMKVVGAVEADSTYMINLTYMV